MRQRGTHGVDALHLTRLVGLVALVLGAPLVDVADKALIVALVPKAGLVQVP